MVVEHKETVFAYNAEEGVIIKNPGISDMFIDAYEQVKKSRRKSRLVDERACNRQKDSRRCLKKITTKKCPLKKNSEAKCRCQHNLTN
ncbi:MAG: hypothetical protein ACD_15C00161G0003 [uncultured bacterium]|nr:MAG: hypothetical protein ACD_15C00161G0003 [uncultured bacterium]